MKKLLTIATINRNNIEGLRSTIRSVVDQKEGWIEYLVIDGASSDGSVEVMDSYRDGIDHGISERDSGISDAFNKAIVKASGEWILLLNSGDRLARHSVQKIAQMLKSSDEELVIFSTEISGGSENGKVLHPRHRNLKKEMSIPHPSSIVRSSVYKKFGFYDEGFKLAMDYEFFLRSYKIISVKEVDEVIVEMDGCGVSSHNIFKRNVECWKARNKNGFNGVENAFFTLRRFFREYAAMGWHK